MALDLLSLIYLPMKQIFRLGNNVDNDYPSYDHCTEYFRSVTENIS